MNAVRTGIPGDGIGIPVALHTSRNSAFNAVFARIAVAEPTLIVLDPSPSFSDDRLLHAEFNGGSIYRDSNHLSVAGSLCLQPLFEDLFVRIEEFKQFHE